MERAVAMSLRGDWFKDDDSALSLETDDEDITVRISVNATVEEEILLVEAERDRKLDDTEPYASRA